MKSHSRLTKCGLAVIAAFCFTASECDEWKHNVLFLPDYDTADQIILPGTAISDKDADSLKTALSASDVSFYIIQPWQDGVPAKPFGKLPFPECLKPHDINPDIIPVPKGNKTGISRTNFSRWTRVIGMGCQTRCSSGINIHRSKKSSQGSLDLVNAVKPILKKYQKEK